jgi:hypothetical protein
MKRALIGLGLLSLAGCGGFGGIGDTELQENQGAALVIVEMPFSGTSFQIAQLQVQVTTLAGQPLANLQFAGNDLNLASGKWPQATGSCAPLKDPAVNPGMADAPATFLPGNSACISFALLHDFDPNDQTDSEILVSLQINALDAATQSKAAIIHSVRVQRGVILGDPSRAASFNDVSPFVATLSTE